jgi:hypothetical protein
LVAAASPPQIVAAKGARDEDVASTVAVASLVAAASPPQRAEKTAIRILAAGTEKKRVESGRKRIGS